MAFNSIVSTREMLKIVRELGPSMTESEVKAIRTLLDFVIDRLIKEAEDVQSRR